MATLSRNRLHDFSIPLSTSRMLSACAERRMIQEPVAGTTVIVAIGASLSSDQLQ